MLRSVIMELKALDIRTSLFVDFDNPDIPVAKELGADRVELYTEPYAEFVGTTLGEEIFKGFQAAASLAQQAGLGVNAGHDLNLNNLSKFLQIPDILEVSIGHAVIVESLEMGIDSVMKQYMDIIRRSQRHT